MFKWFIDNSKKIGIGLAVILSGVLVSGLLYFYAPAIVTAVLAFLAGVIIFGYVLGIIFRMGRDDGLEIAQADRNGYLQQSSHENMGFNNMNTLQATESLSSKNIMVIENDSIEEDFSSFFCSGFTSCFGRFFHSSSKKPKGTAIFDELDDAIARCKKESENQNAEVRIITNALKEFNQESGFLINQKGDFQAVTQQTKVSESREKEGCKQQLAELITLMHSYPESGFRDSPCVETVELYIEARIEHHNNILLIAGVLLPNLSSLLNEAKSIQNTGMTSGTR